MSEEQLSALLAKLSTDTALQAKFNAAADLDALVAFAKEAGFDLSTEDWQTFQAKQSQDLSDEDLERVAGGGGGLSVDVCGKGYTKNYGNTCEWQDHCRA